MSESENQEFDAVEATLRQIRAGVRQRHAEIASLSEAAEHIATRLADLRAAEFLQEAKPVSPRPVVGPLLVVARRVFYHLFVKWSLSPVLQQQNRFNQAASQAIQDILEAQRHLNDEVRKLRLRVDAVNDRDSRLDSSAGPRP